MLIGARAVSYYRGGFSIRHCVSGDPQQAHRGHVRDGGRLLSGTGHPGGRRVQCYSCTTSCTLSPCLLAHLCGPSGRADWCLRRDTLPGLSNTCRSLSSWHWAWYRSWCLSWSSCQATRPSPSASDRPVHLSPDKPSTVSLKGG